MAKAPRPGSVRQEADANQVFVLTVDGIPQRLAIADLGPKDAVRVRKLQLGVSLAGLLVQMQDEAQVDIDVPCILWWLARIKTGEKKLTFEQAVDEFPTYADITERFSAEIEDLNDEDDGSPEA